MTLDDKPVYVRLPSVYYHGQAVLPIWLIANACGATVEFSEQSRTIDFHSRAAAELRPVPRWYASLRALRGFDGLGIRPVAEALGVRVSAPRGVGPAAEPEAPSSEARSQPALVLVALSGGVDSAVAAALLQEQGHDVIGATLLTPGADPASAAEVCARLGIPHMVRDVRREFERRVVEPTVAAYAAGLTPNPCVWCNPELKLAALMALADELDCERVATGHYAMVRRAGDGHHLLRGADPAKDQSYALYRLSQEVLARLLLPPGADAQGRCARGGCAPRPGGDGAGGEPGRLLRPRRRARSARGRPEPGGGCAGADR